MREPPPTSYETMLATCKDPGSAAPGRRACGHGDGRHHRRQHRRRHGQPANRRVQTSPTPPATTSRATTCARFDDSRRWERRRHGEAAHAIVARRFPEQGHKHVSINREFSNDELPHRIAFLISVYAERDEPPF